MPALHVTAECGSDLGTQGLTERVDGCLVALDALPFIVGDFNVNDLRLADGQIVVDSLVRGKQDAGDLNAHAQHFGAGRHRVWIGVDFSGHRLKKLSSQMRDSCR